MADAELITVYDAGQKRISFSSFYIVLHDVFKYRFVLYNLIGTNLKARYRRSVFGFLWSLLNPLFTMIILAVVFSTVYKTSFTELGLYIMSGLLPWNLIANSLLGGSLSLVNAEGYLKKVYLPKQVFPITVLGVEVVNFCLSLVSLFVLAITLGARPNFTWLLLPFGLFLLSVFLLGMVLGISVITVYFRDFSHILQIGLTGLFYLTPIVYPISLISKPALVEIIRLNPFYYFIEIFHEILKDSIVPSGSMWLTCILLSMGSYVLGVLIFQFKGNDIIYRL
jgi:ABC-type polysaccharide/polyol phosphate export permease